MPESPDFPNACHFANYKDNAGHFWHILGIMSQAQLKYIDMPNLHYCLKAKYCILSRERKQKQHLGIHKNSLTHYNSVILFLSIFLFPSVQLCIWRHICPDPLAPLPMGLFYYVAILEDLTASFCKQWDTLGNNILEANALLYNMPASFKIMLTIQTSILKILKGLSRAKGLLSPRKGSMNEIGN